MMHDLPTYAVNLRRLLAWHHVRPGREAAEVLGASEHTVSGWLTGKREPGGRYLKEIERVYGVNALALAEQDPEDFGPSIADPARAKATEERIAARLGR